MRASGPDIAAALAAAPDEGLVVRQFVWITARRRDNGAPAAFGFWSGLLPITLDVVSGLDGSIVNRIYADGALKGVDNVRLTTGLRIKPWSFTLDKNHDLVRLALREYDPRGGLVEYHRVPLSISARRPVAPPRCRFIGQIDQLDFTRPTANGEGGVVVSCVGATAELTRTNPAKRSDETQRLRFGDRHSRYADVAHQWDIKWGEQATGTPEAGGASGPTNSGGR